MPDARFGQDQRPPALQGLNSQGAQRESTPMKLVRDFRELAADAEFASKRGSAVTIGVFDGLHLGHQALISKTVELARANELAAVVVTFRDHPLTLLAPPYAPPRLLDRARKLELLEQAGLDYAVELEFTAQLAATPPDQFVHDNLVGCARAKFIICGYDFSFGKAGAGNIALLEELAPRTGYTLSALGAVDAHNIRVKSTMIRDLVLSGDMERAAELLTRPFELVGTVESGAGRGKGLGFPTANLAIDPTHVLPGRGVYICSALIEKPASAVMEVRQTGASKRHGAIVNVGTAPTFGGTRTSIEAHLLNFSEDIRGAVVRLFFYRRLRDERKFAGVDELVRQLTADRQTAVEFFDRNAGIFENE